MEPQLTIHRWFLVTGFLICLISCLFHLFRILLSGMPKDFSEPLGSFKSALIYSFTGAMSPLKKETAYLHFPTYTAGIFFHVGTFLSFILLVFHFFSLRIPEWLIYTSIILLIISTVSGLSLFIKRLLKHALSGLSTPDDYLSNLLVTGFHFISIINLVWDSLHPYLFVFATLLFLYIPIGKLRHTVYFFTSRIHLAFFYGRLGVCPLKK